MAFLTIQPVTKDNWRELIKLKVREDQTSFVASNLYSIAESQFVVDDDEQGQWILSVFGIYDRETPVGFFMYGLNYELPKMQAFISRLMVDEKYQRKGYSKFGLEKMIEIFRADARVKAVGISYEPENDVARHLYANYGFVETGEIAGGEVVALLRLQL